MPAIAGLRGTGNWATDERPKNFREYILWRNPNGTAPLLALMSKVAKESTNDPEFSWWDESIDLVRVQVNGALGAAATLVTVDSADPTTSTPNAHWGSALNLVPGDVLMVEPSADNATFDHEHVLVTAVHSATQFSIQRAYAGTSAASIGDDAYLLKVGSSYAEGTDAPTSATRNPIKFFNYTQIFKTAYEITNTADMTKTRTGDSRTNDKKRRMHDHSNSLEMAMLFGQKSETTGSNGKPLRTTAGLRAQIASTNVKILAANWTVANAATAGNDFLSAIQSVFDWESSSGDERIILAGNNALNRLNMAIHKGTGVGATTINFNGMEQAYGMNFQRFTLPQGSVFVKTHPLMNRHSIYKNSMFVLDMGAIKYRPMEGRDTKSQDDIQNKGEDLRRGEWKTEAGLELMSGGLTCGYIGGFDAAIA